MTNFVTMVYKPNSKTDALRNLRSDSAYPIDVGHLIDTSSWSETSASRLRITGIMHDPGANQDTIHVFTEIA